MPWPTLALLSWLAAGLASAQAPAPLAAAPDRAPETRKFAYSGYEQATIDAAFAALRLQPAKEAEGKVVESIEEVRLEVIEQRDPAPRFLNVFHVLSRSHVIEREVLLEPGRPFRQTLADETQRNLAGLPQLSLVLVVTAQGSAPGTVRVVVITKDVWSLRLNWNLALTGSGFESLSINPSETNFLGRHQTLGLLFNWLPRSYSFGAQYAVPRVLGSRVSAAVDGGVIFDSRTGRSEGSFGDLEVTYPLWSSQTRWSWGAGISWLREVTRRYSGGQLAAFALDPRTDCARTPALCVPDAYRTDVQSAGAFVTRSFGWAVKHDLTLGFQGRLSHYALPDLSAFDPATAQAYAQARLPVGDDRVGPYVQYRTYRTDFLRVLDLETMALQEDYRVGLDAYLRAYPVARFLGSSRSLVGISAGASFTAALGDGLARAGVESVSEIQTADGQVGDASVQATLRLVTPRLAAGRVVLDAFLLDRYADRLNRVTTLGGDSRLRGYPSQFFVGRNALAVNLEYRSHPWELFHTVQLGGVAFYDAGDAFDEWGRFHLNHALGLGARILFPQIDRLVFRIDVAFPLSQPTPAQVSPVAFFVTFGQAFPLYAVTPATAITR